MATIFDKIQIIKSYYQHRGLPGIMMNPGLLGSENHMGALGVSLKL